MRPCNGPMCAYRALPPNNRLWLQTAAKQMSPIQIAYCVCCSSGYLTITFRFNINNNSIIKMMRQKEVANPNFVCLRHNYRKIIKR